MIQLFAEATVYLRHPDTTVAPCPDWMTAAGAVVGTSNTGERLNAIHPEDLDSYFGAFLGASGSPGEVFEVEYRITGEGGQWATERARFVDLNGYEDLGAMLVAVKQTGDVATAIVAVDRDAEAEYDTIPWIVCTLDRHVRITSIDGDVEGVLGRPPAEVVGRMPMEFMHPNEWYQVTVRGKTLLDTPGLTLHSRRCYVHPDGRELWVDCTEVNRMDPETGEGDILMMSVDITERMVAEQVIKTSHEQFQLLAEEMGTAVFLADRSTTITYRNTRFDELLEGAAGISDLIDLFSPDDRENVRHHLRRLLEPDGGDRCELEARAVDDKTVLSLTCRSVSVEGAEEALVGSLVDVTATLELRRRAEHDALTGLFNRVAFEERLEEILTYAPHDALVLFVDLDGFKGVNDTHGHGIGDLVLQQVAVRLQGAIRPTDIIGRYGGDEFVIVCTEVHHREETIRDRLAGALMEPIEWDGGFWNPAASIGSARPVLGDTVLDVLGRADEAMFDIKRLRHTRSGTIRV